MYKRTFRLAFILLFSLVFASACGNISDMLSSNNDNNEENEANAEAENNTNEEENQENNNDTEVNNENNENNENDGEIKKIGKVKEINNDENNDDEKEDSDAKTDIAVEDSSFSDQIEYMEEETEGTAEVLYESDESQEHDMEGVSLTLEGYTFVELEDFHKDFSIPFDDETDGGVVIAEYTMKNDSDDDVSFMPSFYMTYSGAEKDFNNYAELLPMDEQIVDKMTADDDYELKSGDEVSGYYTYPFGGDALDDVLEEGEAQIDINQPQEDPDDYSSTLGEEDTFTINFDQDSADEKEASDSEGFYEDKVTAESLGDKSMIDEEDNIGDTEELRDVDVTLEGYQFTELEPGKEIENAFADSDDGVVLLTVKFDIDNGGDDEISKSSVDSTLTVNDGKQYTLNEASLLNYSMDDTIESGDSDELLQIYALDQEQYEKIWKDKPFELEIGPFRDKDAEDISKGHSVEFEL